MSELSSRRPGRHLYVRLLKAVASTAASSTSNSDSSTGHFDERMSHRLFDQLGTYLGQTMSMILLGGVLFG